MHQPLEPYLEAVFIAGAAGEPMAEAAEVQAIVGAGLEGDRYRLGTGRYSPRDVCQVTVIAAEAVEQMREVFGIDVGAGQHRRNLVTRGLDLDDLRDRRIAVGAEVILEYDRPRPPCGYLERITEPNMTRALGRCGAGIGVRVVAGGTIRVGDEIRLLPGVASRPPRRLP